MSAGYAPRILTHAIELGRVDIVRVYAAAGPSSGWEATPGYRLIHAGSGKNAADLLLSIDAMELALSGGVETFILATSDGDFTHLALRLREHGMHVLGLGEPKAPQAFRLACSSFALLTPEPARIPAPPQKPPASACQDLDLLIRAVIATYSQGGRGIRIVDLGNKMHSIHGVHISTLPEQTWRAYLTARPALYAVDPPSSQAMVRFLPAGFAN